MAAGAGTRAAAVLALSVGLVVGLSGPAAAAGRGRPEIVNPATCAGTFAVDGGVRSCTVVATSRRQGEPVTAVLTVVSGTFPGGSFREGFEGTSLRTTVVETVQRLEQTGSRPATQVVTERVVASELVPVSCVLRSQESRSGYVDRETGQYVEGTQRDVRTPVDLSACATRGLFTA